MHVHAPPQVKTAGIYLRAATMVSDYALLLFGGTLSRGATPGSLTLLQGHLTFTAPSHVTELIFGLRSHLDGIFAARLHAPADNSSRAGSRSIDAEADRIVRAVIRLLREEPPAHEQYQHQSHGAHGGGSSSRRY